MKIVLLAALLSLSSACSNRVNNSDVKGSDNSIFERSDLFYQCTVLFGSTTPFYESSMESTEVLQEKILKKLDREKKYSWMYVGKEGTVSKDVLDKEILGSTCNKTHSTLAKSHCTDARDGNGYVVNCNEENLGKVVRKEK